MAGPAPDADLEYSPNGLARSLGGAEGCRAPERPRFVRDLRRLEVGGTLHIIGGESDTAISGRGLDWVFELVVPLMDGTRTVAQLLAELPGLKKPVLDDLLQLLFVNGLVEDVGGVAPEHGRTHAEGDRASQLAYFSRYLRITGLRRNRYEVQQSVEAARVVVVGANAEAANIAASLTRLGVGRLTAVSMLENASTHGAVDLVVAVGERSLLAHAAAWSLAAGAPLLAVDPERHLLGPLCHPGASACPTCAELQLADTDDLPSADLGEPQSQLWRRAVAARASQQATAHVTGLYHSNLINSVEELRPASRRAGPIPVWRLPACPACGHAVSPLTVRWPSGHVDNLALLYHWNAVLGPWQTLEPATFQRHYATSTQQLMSGAYLRHEWADQQRLPQVHRHLGTNDILWGDGRPVTDCQPTLEHVAAVLYYSAGAIATELPAGGYHLRRFTASSGNLGSAEVYLVARDIEGLAPGVYHYLPPTHALETLRSGDHVEAVHKLVGPGQSALFVIVGALDRQVTKYERRGYLYCLLDAGLMAHRIELVARALGIDATLRGDLRHGTVIDVLDLDPARLTPCAALALRLAGEDPAGAER